MSTPSQSNSTPWQVCTHPTWPMPSAAVAHRPYYRSYLIDEGGTRNLAYLELACLYLWLGSQVQPGGEWAQRTAEYLAKNWKSVTV